MNSEAINETRYTGKDIAFAFTMLVCGFLYCNLINLDSLGAGVTVFTVIFCLPVIVYLKAAGFHQTRFSLLSLSLIILSALTFILFDNHLIKGLNFIFIMVLTVYWISLFTGRNLKKNISVYILGDFYSQILVVPFSNFTSCFRAIGQLFSSNKKGKSLILGLVGIILVFPVLVWVVSLLVQADAAFEALIGHLSFNISVDILADILLGIPVALYLFGLVYGDRYQKHTDRVTIESVDKRAASLRFAPEVMVYTALTALNIVYLAYFLSQTAYLFSAFSSHLPELMTYAGYARRGFFELCAVAAINLAVITLAYLLVIRGKEKVLKAETAILCVFTMMMIITAISKMLMYINYYGLTQLRVYTSWFMILLFFIFTVIIVRQFRKFNATQIMISGFVILFMILSFSNIDGQIAKYNIARYENGSLEELDVDALSVLSDAAVPYLYQLYLETDDESLQPQLRAVLFPEDRYEISLDGRQTFRDFNFQSYRADIIRSRF